MADDVRTERERLVEEVRARGAIGGCQGVTRPPDCPEGLPDQPWEWCDRCLLRALAAADLLSEEGPDEPPQVDGQHLMAWLSDTLQAAGVAQEDPVAGILVEVAATAAQGVRTDPGYAAHLVEGATRRYMEVLSGEASDER